MNGRDPHGNVTAEALGLALDAAERIANPRRRRREMRRVCALALRHGHMWIRVPTWGDVRVLGAGSR